MNLIFTIIYFIVYILIYNYKNKILSWDVSAV